MTQYSPTVSLCRELIACKSVTPDDAGCQDILERELKAAGFTCITLRENMFPTFNLLALYSTDEKACLAGDPELIKNRKGPYDPSGYVFPKPLTVFLGHTDVVPPGNTAEWKSDPFEAVITEEGFIRGRGSADMKGSVAAMTEALKRFTAKHKEFKGTVALLVTSNEEGDAVGGIPFVADRLRNEHIYPDYCLVGEPSCSETLGDTIKTGRRGSMTAHITVHGKQGHVAYPEQINNAAHAGAELVHALCNHHLDDGDENFPPSSFNVTNFNAGTGAENVAPGSCEIMCNWRFNPQQTTLGLQKMTEKYLEKLRIYATVRYVVNGHPFISDKDSILVSAIKDAVKRHTGIDSKLSTSGGTSDGRFIAPLGTMVAEFGPCNATIHKVNEEVKAADLDTLTDIYESVLEKLHL